MQPENCLSRGGGGGHYGGRLTGLRSITKLNYNYNYNDNILINVLTIIIMTRDKNKLQLQLYLGPIWL